MEHKLFNPFNIYYLDTENNLDWMQHLVCQINNINKQIWWSNK